MEVLEVLLKRGADVHLKRRNGLSTLDQAIRDGSDSVIKMIAKYVDIEMTDEIKEILES